MNPSRCSGCGLELPSIDGPVHRYMESTPACWAKYGELLAREYENPEYMAAHRLTVDTYAIQHPGTPSPQSIQSVAVHLISIYAVLERSMDQRQATALIQVCADKGRFQWLTPPAPAYPLNVLHPLSATSAAEHSAAVREWAQCAWQAWAAHHGQVRVWAAQFSDA
jgi:Family of unknown function (DUF5946)